jgi:hypothetical protein
VILNPYAHAAAPGGGNISFIAADGFAATSGTLPGAWAAGDLAIVIAHRNNSATLPALPAGWTSLGTDTEGSRCTRVGYRVLQGGDTTTGTWTNATRIIVLIYRGQHATPVDAANVAVVSGSGDTITIPTLTMAVVDGTSWVVGLAAHQLASEGSITAPTGMTKRTSEASTFRAAAFDTNGGVASWSNQTIVTDALTEWFGWSVEIRSS